MTPDQLLLPRLQTGQIGRCHGRLQLRGRSSLRNMTEAVVVCIGIMQRDSSSLAILEFSVCT